MESKTCCFTGHRAILKREYPVIQERLEIEIVKLIKQGVTCFCAGGALGFDTLAAKTVLKLKGHYPDIRLVLCLPCKNQMQGWSEANKKTYGQILKQSDQAIYISEKYYPGCMQARNRRLIDNSQYCICYLNVSQGGTAYTVKYARRKGLQIVNLAMNVTPPPTS